MQGKGPLRIFCEFEANRMPVYLCAGGQMTPKEPFLLLPGPKGKYLAGFKLKRISGAAGALSPMSPLIKMNVFIMKIHLITFHVFTLQELPDRMRVGK